MALGERRVLDPTTHLPALALRQRVPWVTYAVIGVCVVVYLIDVQRGREITKAWALSADGIRANEWYRLVTMNLVHGFELHILFNMLAAWQLGRFFERAIGSLRFFAVSLVTAMGSAAFVLWFESPYPTVGASGMILGWAGGLVVVLPPLQRASLLQALLPVAILTFLPLLLQLFPSGGEGSLLVSWQGHIGGFLFGMVCGALLKARLFKSTWPVVVGLSIAAAVLAGLSLPAQ